MDDIVLKSTVRSIKLSDNRRYIQKQVIERTWGFDFDTNFRPMLIQVIGLSSVERLEQKLNPKVIHALRAALSSLKQVRNTEAHTHIRDTAKVLDAPSVTISRFWDVYNGLVHLDQYLRKQKY